jgi:hypothetical protein
MIERQGCYDKTARAEKIIVFDLKEAFEVLRSYPFGHNIHVVHILSIFYIQRSFHATAAFLFGTLAG